MLNFKKIFSSSINTIKETFSFTKIQRDTQKQVTEIISTDIPAANDEVFEEKTKQTVNDINNSTNNIINSDEEIDYKVLGDYSGVKILTLKNQKIKLVFEQGKIKKALKDVKGKYIHLNAKAIRQLTQILQKKSTELNRVSYSVKRNIQNIDKKSEGEINHANKKEPKLNGSKKHNDTILRKQKREKIQAEKIKKEQYRIEKETHMDQDYKILFRYQTVLSKCNTQGDIVKGSQNIAEIVLKTLAARKGIILNNFNKFTNNQKNFQVLKKVLNEYLTIDTSYSIEGKLNRDALFNIFMNASEIYSTYLYKKNKSASKKKKPGPNIYENQYKGSNEDIKQKKDDWVNKYYPNDKAA